MNPDLTYLVVDDFSTMRRIVGGLLRQCGATRILEAEDGVQALRIIESKPVDFVISDWNMPSMTGLDLLKTLRAHPKFSRMPLLLITAEGKKENIVEAAQAGADGYIVKPFTQDILQEKLTRILSKHSLLPA
jgi:two-component system, chemotaxis family, chemotaxis protein CheY